MHSVIRSTLWLTFFASILAAWWVMYAMSIGMGLDVFGRATPSMNPMMMDMMMGSFTPLFIMWAAMMAAMMLPTLVPTLRAYEDLIASADGTRAGWSGVLLGYFAVWVAFAAGIAGLQLTLRSLGVVDMMGAATSLWITAAVLIAVGAFQFSRVKEICHGVCHAPMHYFLGHWRRGPIGGLRMGLGLGIFCVGCCWGFMALGFAGGVMSLLWMGAATFFMVLEKLPQIGHRITKPLGVALIVAGLVLAATTLITGDLT
jgi:predicted metal-binding membrane protein